MNHKIKQAEQRVLHPEDPREIVNDLIPFLPKSVDNFIDNMGEDKKRSQYLNRHMRIIMGKKRNIYNLD